MSVRSFLDHEGRTTGVQNLILPQTTVGTTGGRVNGIQRSSSKVVVSGRDPDPTRKTPFHWCSGPGGGSGDRKTVDPHRSSGSVPSSRVGSEVPCPFPSLSRPGTCYGLQTTTKRKQERNRTLTFYNSKNGPLKGRIYAYRGRL